MNLDTYIEKLQLLKQRHGGKLPVVDSLDQEILDPEEVGGAIVVCEER